VPLPLNEGEQTVNRIIALALATTCLAGVAHADDAEDLFVGMMDIAYAHQARIDCGFRYGPDLTTSIYLAEAMLKTTPRGVLHDAWDGGRDMWNGRLLRDGYTLACQVGAIILEDDVLVGSGGVQ